MSSETNGNYHLTFGLSADIPQYEYQSKEHFLFLFNHELHLGGPEYIIFTDIDNETFRNDFIDSDLPGFETYSISHRILLYKMESNTHAVTHDRFFMMLHSKILNMGKDEDEGIESYGAAHVKGKDRIKRADLSYKPVDLPKDRSRHWPSLVVEVGYSETIRKLESDVWWWTTESKGDVKSVITISVNRYAKNIIFSQWDKAGTKVYENTISKNANGTIDHTNPNPLIIQFQTLFLRQPTGSETDVIFTIANLKRLCGHVWRVEFED